MRKKSAYLLSLGLFCLTLVSCGSKQFAVYAPGENLSALTKITESDNICQFPYGGDNGEKLFFTIKDRKNGFSNIYKKDNPLSASMNQKTGGGNYNFCAVYCAATNKIVFSGRQTGAARYDIYMMDDSQGNALTQITNSSDAGEAHPSISKDGRIVVYDKRTYTSADPYTDPSPDAEIWLRNLQTRESVLLGSGSMPSLSPDGRTIVFVKVTVGETVPTLWTMNIDGSNQIQLTDVNLGSVFFPRFSPDGNQIVFSCLKREKKDHDLYVIDRNGNSLTQLTINDSYDSQPYWASDGNIYFTSDRGGKGKRFQIWRFKYGNASSYTPSNYTSTPSQPASPYHSQSTYHTVSQGETITQIAQRYNITVRDIVKWNNLSTMTLKPGMRLKVSAQ